MSKISKKSLANLALNPFSGITYIRDMLNSTGSLVKKTVETPIKAVAGIFENFKNAKAFKAELTASGLSEKEVKEFINWSLMFDPKDFLFKEKGKAEYKIVELLEAAANDIKATDDQKKIASALKTELQNNLKELEKLDDEYKKQSWEKTLKEATGADKLNPTVYTIIGSSITHILLAICFMRGAYPEKAKNFGQFFVNLLTDNKYAKKLPSLSALGKPDGVLNKISSFIGKNKGNMFAGLVIFFAGIKLVEMVNHLASNNIDPQTKKEIPTTTKQKRDDRQATIGKAAVKLQKARKNSPAALSSQ